MNSTNSFVYSCILDEVDNNQDAAEVNWSLNNIIAAYEARLEVEKRHWENHGWGAAATIVKYNSWQLLNL